MHFLNSQRAQAPIIVDFEASGFGSTSYPIEVGVVMEDGIRFCELIKPAPGWIHWDETAESVHGISRDLLERSGREAQSVAQNLNALLGNKTVYCDGWAVDYAWLRTLFWAAQLEATFHLSPLELILNAEQMAIWHDVKRRVTAQLGGGRHRASIDAQIIQTTYVETRAGK